MKTTCLMAATVSLLLSGTAISQEGNAALKEILENKRTQDIMRTLKNDPEAAARAAKENPDDLIRNATQLFNESQKKSGAVRATRSVKPTGDRALKNINNLLGTPVSTNPQAMPVPVGDIKDYKVDSSKISKLKNVAREAIPGLAKIIPNDNPPAKPQVSGVPKLPDMKAVQRTAPKVDVASARPTPLNVSSVQAPPAPIRSMQPTVPQIPDSPELFSAAVPAPKALGPRYPEPKKFRAPKAGAGDSETTRKPEKDEMVITSNESVMDRNKHLLTFHGDVEVEMDGMHLTCDHMIVYLDKANKMERIVATGGTVQIMKTGENGQPQLAKARRAEYVAATKTSRLSGGPPYLQNGDQYINTDSEDAVIELGGDGKYKVFNPNSKTGRNVIVIPISNSKKLTNGLGLDDKVKIR